MVHKSKAALLVQRNEGQAMVGKGNAQQRSAQDHRAVAVVYAARGWSNTRIAEAMGVGAETVCRWRAEPGWQPALDAALDRIIREPTALFNERVPAALEKLDVRVADDSRPDVQMRAVTEVFDRAFGKPAAVAGGTSGVVVNIVFGAVAPPGDNPYITYDSADVVEGEAHVI